MKWNRETHVEWTNWTFGIWWGPIGKSYCIGIDFGPVESVWRRRK